MILATLLEIDFRKGIQIKVETVTIDIWHSKGQSTGQIHEVIRLAIEVGLATIEALKINQPSTTKSVQAAQQISATTKHIEQKVTFQQLLSIPETFNFLCTRWAAKNSARDSWRALQTEFCKEKSLQLEEKAKFDLKFDLS